jgi:hypothetical protein
MTRDVSGAFPPEPSFHLEIWYIRYSSNVPSAEPYSQQSQVGDLGQRSVLQIEFVHRSVFWPFPGVQWAPVWPKGQLLPKIYRFGVLPFWCKTPYPSGVRDLPVTGSSSNSELKQLFSGPHWNPENQIHRSKAKLSWLLQTPSVSSNSARPRAVTTPLSYKVFHVSRFGTSRGSNPQLFNTESRKRA